MIGCSTATLSWETRLYDTAASSVSRFWHSWFSLLRSRSSRKHLQARTTRRRRTRRRRKSRTSSRWSTRSPRASRRRTTSSLTWVREDVLKAQGNKEYVPFTVTVDPSKVERGQRRVLLARRVERTPPRRRGRGAADAKKDDKKDDKTRTRRPTTRTRTSAFVPVTAGQTPMRISRSFTVPGRQLRRLPDRQGADARQGAEERAAAEGVGDQADGRRCRTSGTASWRPAR